jgi:hypothetical protein
VIRFSILKTPEYLGGVPVSTGGRSGQWLQAERQLLKLATNVTAKREDEDFVAEAEFALAA